MKVGFIGFGAIGTPMAARILEAGYKLSVWNKTPAKVAELTARGARQASTPAELADSCDVLCICVTGVEALEDVICITFLKWYFLPFAEGRDAEELDRIVTRTALKMSPEGRARVLREFDLPEPFVAAFRA